MIFRPLDFKSSEDLSQPEDFQSSLEDFCDSPQVFQRWTKDF